MVIGLHLLFYPMTQDIGKQRIVLESSTYTHDGFVVLDFNKNVLFNFGFNLLFF